MPNIWEEKIRKAEKVISDKGKIGYIYEDAMLADFMTWAKNSFPQLRQAIFHIENEGDRSGKDALRRGAQSLAKGKLKGVFDVCCVYKGKMIWFEFKLPDGKWSEEQKSLRILWSSWGIKIVEITNFDTWKKEIIQILTAI